MSQPDNMEAVRAAVLKAASEIFADKGVKKSKMVDIADRAGVELDDLKGLFKNKNLIVLAVQIEALQEVTRAYLDKMPDATLGEAIRYIIRIRCEFIEENAERTMIFFTNAFNGKQPWSQMLDQLIWKLSVEFAALFEKSVRQGEIRKDVDINTAVRAIVSFYLTGIVVMGLRAETFDAKSVSEFICSQVDMLLKELQA